jgi:hypothetical protein
MPFSFFDHKRELDFVKCIFCINLNHVVFPSFCEGDASH